MSDTKPTQSDKPTPLGFDDLFLSPPADKKELAEMRNDASTLLTEQAEMFCREVVLFGRTPTLAYEMAYSSQDVDTGSWIKPDAAGYRASQLLRLPEVVERIKELRNETLTWYKMPREEMLMALRSIALNPDAKNADRINALKQIGTAEGYNIEKENTSGAQITIVMPWQPKQLGVDDTLVLDGGSTRV